MTTSRTADASLDIWPLERGWTVASTAPGALADGRALDSIADADWLPARIPGTAAGALRDAGLPTDVDIDGRDWWFRTVVDLPDALEADEVVLRLDGVATCSETFLDRELVTTADSMFVDQVVAVGQLASGPHELAIRCRALTPLLAIRRPPRARWRTRLVADNNLRWFRTMIMGRAPGFAPGPPAVGPWRPVRVERRRGLVVERLTIVPRVADDTGVIAVDARLRPLGGRRVVAATLKVEGPSGVRRTDLELRPAPDGSVGVVGTVTMPAVERWWPHTHGEPTLHD
ncbi:MAG TPA: hypothetical protein VEG29_00355, partial [Candidatus Binatia bacterium]|nr:hypothetical protein [Candidatus Binatia bacterium]